MLQFLKTTLASYRDIENTLEAGLSCVQESSLDEITRDRIINERNPKTAMFS